MRKPIHLSETYRDADVEWYVSSFLRDPPRGLPRIDLGGSYKLDVDVEGRAPNRFWRVYLFKGRERVGIGTFGEVGPRPEIPSLSRTRWLGNGHFYLLAAHQGHGLYRRVLDAMRALTRLGIVQMSHTVSPNMLRAWQAMDARVVTLNGKPFGVFIGLSPAVAKRLAPPVARGGVVVAGARG